MSASMIVSIVVIGVSWFLIDEIRGWRRERRIKNAQAADFARQMQARGYQTIPPQWARHGQPIVLDTEWNRALAQLESTGGSLPSPHRWTA